MPEEQFINPPRETTFETGAGLHLTDTDHWVSEPTEETPQTDWRFRNVIGEDAWARLPPRVQKRFSKVIRPSAPIHYVGRVLETRLNGLGWVLAQCLRVIGAPLPLTSHQSPSDAIVDVSTDPDTGDQIWARHYGGAQCHQQAIVSRKCFAGPTGLEERVTPRIGMALGVRENDGALVFQSESYFVAVFGARLRLPMWMAPGRMTITHRDLGDGRFNFELRLSHAWFGSLLYQIAEFHDPL